MSGAAASSTHIVQRTGTSLTKAAASHLRSNRPSRHNSDAQLNALLAHRGRSGSAKAALDGGGEQSPI